MALPEDTQVIDEQNLASRSDWERSPALLLLLQTVTFKSCCANSMSAARGGICVHTAFYLYTGCPYLSHDLKCQVSGL